MVICGKLAAACCSSAEAFRNQGMQLAEARFGNALPLAVSRCCCSPPQICINRLYIVGWIFLLRNRHHPYQYVFCLFQIFNQILSEIGRKCRSEQNVSKQHSYRHGTKFIVVKRRPRVRYLMKTDKSDFEKKKRKKKHS